MQIRLITDCPGQSGSVRVRVGAVADGEYLKRDGDRIVGDTPAGGGASYLVYTALLTQSGTDAPTATVLENTLSGTVVWSRDSAGNYSATLAGAFPAAGTIPRYSGGSGRWDLIDPMFGGDARYINYGRDTDNTVLVSSQTQAGSSDDLLNNTIIEIRVYS